jgi:hypothetical protein
MPTDPQPPPEHIIALRDRILATGAQLEATIRSGRLGEHPPPIEEWQVCVDAGRRPEIPEGPLEEVVKLLIQLAELQEELGEWERENWEIS